MASLSFYDVTVTPFVCGLKNAHAFISKGVEHAKASSTENNLLHASIHPDMKDLIFQIQRFTDSAKGAPPRINPAIEAITLPDTETTFPELLARIEKVITYLEGIDKKHFEGREGTEIKMPYGKEIVLELNALDYVMKVAHPNFWFHLVTTYDILRKEGVDVGKRDFLAGNTSIKGFPQSK